MIVNQSVVARAGCWEDEWALMTKEHEGNLGDEGNVSHLDCGGSYITTYLSKFRELYSWKGDFHCVCISFNRSFLKMQTQTPFFLLW